MVAEPFINCLRRVPKRQDNNTQGFTLLEVICALAILGLVTLAALTFLGQSFRLWEHNATWGAEERRVRVVTRRFEDFTGRLYAGKMPQGENSGFHGEDIAIEGWLEADDGLFLTGITWNASDQTLVYWEESGGKREEMQLAAGVDAFELQYLNEDQSWVSTWEEQTPLPAAIRWEWNYRKKTMPPCIIAIRGGQEIPAP